MIYNLSNYIMIIDLAYKVIFQGVLSTGHMGLGQFQEHFSFISNFTIFQLLQTMLAIYRFPFRALFSNFFYVHILNLNVISSHREFKQK